MPRQAEYTPSVRRRALFVAPPGVSWSEVILAIRRDGVQVELAPVESIPVILAACARRTDTVVVADLKSEPNRGLDAVVALRGRASRVPVVVVASNPSHDLLRRLHMSGVFYVALDPVSPEEMRSILHDAFEQLARGRADAGTCHVRPRVLLVHDDDQFSAVARAALEMRGCAVTRVRTGEEGTRTAAEGGYDLVVLDVMLQPALTTGGPAATPEHGPPVLWVSPVPLDPATRLRMTGDNSPFASDIVLSRPMDVPGFLDAVQGLLGLPLPGDEPVTR